MTLADWSPEQYVVDFEPVYYAGPTVGAPLEMKIWWVRKCLHDVIFPDAVRAVVHGGQLSGLLMGFSIVEYLVGFYIGRQSTKRGVLSFMERYFPEQYRPFADAIYSNLRCGLVHNLSLQDPWKSTSASFYVDERNDLHLQFKDEQAVFSIYHYLEDANRACIMYFYDLLMKREENQDLIRNFHTRFNKKNGAASMVSLVD